MLVQTCTKEKPTSVLAHRAGGVELCPCSTYSIHRLRAGVKFFLPRVCCFLFAPASAVLALLSYSLFLGSHIG